MKQKAGYKGTGMGMGMITGKNKNPGDKGIMERRSVNYMGLFVILALVALSLVQGVSADPDAAGEPSATLAFFMSSEGFFSHQGGVVDGNDFDESPIQLNDYGKTTEKCELWDCTGWGDVGADKNSSYCSGGWNCTNWNGVTCAEYKCEGW